jgi:hypothetical protein
MPILKPYTTVAKVAFALGISSPDAGQTSAIEDAINAAVALLDRETGRELGPTSADETRYFDGDGSNEAKVDEFTTLTSVETGDYEANEWTSFGPDLRTVKPVGAGPWDTIKLLSASFVEGEASVKVTGKFAHYATLPADVASAATTLAAGMYRADNVAASAGDAVVKSESIGGYSVTYLYGSEAEASGTSALASVKSVIARHRKFAL